MAVPTANVILGFSASAMDYVKSHGSSYSNLLKQSKKEGATGDFMLFDHVNNPNFINFEYQFGLGGNNHRATLTFIDPMNEFEKRYITRDLLWNLAAFEASGNYNLSESQGNNTARVMPPEGLIETQDSFVESGNQTIVKDDMKKRFEASVGKREVYIMFGVGSNMGSWAGPFRMYITNASIDLKESRKITLQLTPSIKSLNLGARVGAYNEPINFSLNGLNSVVKGHSFNLDLKPGRPLDDFIYQRHKRLSDNVARGHSSDAFYTEAYRSLLHGLNLYEELVNLKGSTLGFPEELRPELVQEGTMVTPPMPIFDIHSVVVETIRDYIKNVTGNPNVIVILPNLNVYLREWINDRLLAARNEPLLPEEDQAALPISPPTTPTPPNTSPSPFLPAPYALPFAATGSSMKGNRAAEKLSAVTNILAGLGLSLVLRSESRAYEGGTVAPDSKSEWLPSVIPNAKILMLDPVPGESMAQTLEAFVDSPNVQGGSVYGGTGNFFNAQISTRSKSIIPNHEETLRSIIDSIQAKTKSSYPLEVVQFVENDKDILSFWNKLKFLPAFGGVTEWIPETKSVTEVSPVDENKEYIVFGDIGLITTYLYGTVSLAERQNKRDKYRDKAAEFQAEHKKRLQKGDPTYIGKGPGLGHYEGDEREKLHKKLKNDEFTARLKAYTVYSLGTADQAILATSFYQDQLRKIYDKKRLDQGMDLGPFAATDLETNSFEFTDFAVKTEGVVGAAIKENFPYPVFRYNMKNSNVLELATNLGFNYFSVLDFGINKRIDRLASEVVEGTLDTPYGSFRLETMDDAVHFLGKISAMYGEPPEWALASLRSRIGQGLLYGDSDGGTCFPGYGDVEYILELIKERVIQNQKNRHNTTVLVDQSVEANPFNLLSQVASKAYRLAVQAKIKTLPFFSLSNMHNTIFSNCVLIAQDSPIIKQWTDKSPLNRSLMNSFFTGVWRIMGFKHVISGDGDCFSEFNLVHNKPSVSQPIDEDFILKQERL